MALPCCEIDELKEKLEEHIREDHEFMTEMRTFLLGSAATSGLKSRIEALEAYAKQIRWFTGVSTTALVVGVIKILFFSKGITL